MSEKFEMPSTGFHKELSPASQKIYKTKLNKLAAEGFATVEALEKKKAGVVKSIKSLTGDADTASERAERRVFLSAIFAVIKPQKTKTNAYYKYYQECLPNLEGWVPKNKLKE